MDRRRYFDIMGAAPTAVTIVTTIEPAGEAEPAAPTTPPPGARATPPPVAPAIPLPGAPATQPPGAAPEARGRPVGLTVSAVTSISAEPPILAICLDLRSRTLPIVLRAGRFAVNFLRGDQAELAARFAAPLADRFAGVHWRPGALGVPILVDAALAHAECLVEGRFVVGDHVVVLGRVVDGAPPPAGSRPLMYFRHGFSAWAGP
ncbi:MAG TPA: flavin reductase family protein, partial [Candidatus Binatia bacterium]|nr:flavin reductase family protein [Candidatus Binatia bacterium]